MSEELNTNIELENTKSLKKIRKQSDFKQEEETIKSIETVEEVKTSTVEVKNVSEVKTVSEPIKKVEVVNTIPFNESNDRRYKRLIAENKRFILYDKNILVYDSEVNTNPIQFDKDFYLIFNKKYDYKNLRFRIKK